MNGTVHTCNGQEFSGIAFCKSLRQDDFIYSNHRCHGHYIAHTNDVSGLIAEFTHDEFKPYVSNSISNVTHDIKCTTIHITIADLYLFSRLHKKMVFIMIKK